MTSPAEAICQFLSGYLLSETTHLSFLLPLKPLLLKEKQVLILQKLPTPFALLTPFLPFFKVNGENSHSAFGTSCMTHTGGPPSPLDLLTLTPRPIQWAQTPAVFKVSFSYREM